MLTALLLTDLCSAGSHVEALIGTEFPIAVGVSVGVETPSRLRARLGLGTLPGPYLDTINAVSTSYGWYDDATASLISAALKGSLLIHPHVGWRPFEARGFTLGVGYQLAALGGSLSTVETVEALIGSELPLDEDDARLEVAVAASDHMITPELGWQLLLRDDSLVIHLSLGGALTVGANSTMTMEASGPLSGRVDSALEPSLTSGEELLDETFTSYVHTPTIGLRVGYRFF